MPHAREAWSAMTLLLGMLTGFRTQQSLDRYWEGRASKIPRSSGPLMEKVIGWAKGLTHCHKQSSGPISRMKTMQLSKAKLGEIWGARDLSLILTFGNEDIKENNSGQVTSS